MTAAPPTVSDVDRSDPGGRAWVERAVSLVEADAHRSADTHLLVYPLPLEWGVDLYLKDESTHPTGSLKHRLARSLFLYALCSGQLHEGSTVVEASSGSTAVSGAADVDRSDPGGRAWVERAVALVEADAHRSADTHLLVYPQIGRAHV